VGAARQRGLDELPDLNAPDALSGFGGIPVNARGTMRWGAAFAYLDPARSRRNLAIIADTLVDRVLIERGRARGAIVRRTGEEQRLTADLVVLSAGSYGTPAILGRSGIGAAETLKGLGIRAAVNLQGVGRSLMDHSYVLMSWVARERLRVADERLAREDAPLSLSEVKWASSLCAAGGWDLTVGAWSGTIFDQRAHGVHAHRAGLAPCVMKSISRGSVTLRSADPTVLPWIEHGFLTDPGDHDIAVLLEGIELCRALGATRAWQYWCDSEVQPGQGVDAAERVSWIRASVGGSYHPCGTARIGPADDAAAVVDSHGRVHGVEGLMVADASIFPSIPSANIHLSVLAAAERLAAGLDSTHPGSAASGRQPASAGIGAS
jgi:choline dehydrogenase